MQLKCSGSVAKVLSVLVVHDEPLLAGGVTILVEWCEPDQRGDASPPVAVMRAMEEVGDDEEVGDEFKLLEKSRGFLAALSDSARFGIP